MACKICGEEDCKKHSFSLGKAIRIDQFSGSSPPEVFVGKYGYPHVYTGILAPQERGDTEILSSPEKWHEKKASIQDILSFRNQLIYGRVQKHIKSNPTKFSQVMQEIAMTHKSVSTEFKLEKSVRAEKHPDPRVPLISRAAPVKSARLEENAPVIKKIDYLVNDNDVKSKIAIQELYNSNVQTSNIIKILSAGLLGLKKNRKLVPTRWSITAVDDTLSSSKLERIRYFKEIQEFQVFNAEYLGNHYEFLLLPDKYSFEVIEISLKSLKAWQDYESFFPRKKYADSVTGAYYANRLALTEYLERVQRQATCIVMREVRPEYDVPCGVGILRQASREAFSKQPEKFQSLQEALQAIQSRLRQSVKNYTSKSIVLKNFGKQPSLLKFL